MSYMMVLTSHMMVPTITLFATLNFYLLFKFNIYIKKKKKKQIVPTSHMIVLISHLMLPIEWVPSPQKEYGYYKITQDNKPCITPA